MTSFGDVNAGRKLTPYCRSKIDPPLGVLAGYLVVLVLARGGTWVRCARVVVAQRPLSDLGAGGRAWSPGCCGAGLVGAPELGCGHDVGRVGDVLMGRPAPLVGGHQRPGAGHSDLVQAGVDINEPANHVQTESVNLDEAPVRSFY